MEVSPYDLAKLGYKLIPVSNAGKKPIIGNWTGYDADGKTVATTDPSKIAEWSNLYVGCNWGIVCWEILVVDIDIDKVTGESCLPVWRKLCDENNIPDSPCVITGSGGRHYFYKKPSFDFKNKTKTIINGKIVPIDVKVGGGGMVVAVGSRHENGQFYRYEDDTKPLPPIDQLPTISDSFVRKYFVENEPETLNVPQLKDVEFSQEESPLFVTSCCWQYIDKMAPSIMGECGSNAIYSVCGKIFWGFDLNEDQGWELLNRWNQVHAKPPWSQKELEHKVADSLKNANRLTYERGSLRPKPKNDKEYHSEISPEAWRRFLRELKKGGKDTDCPDVSEDVLSVVPNGTVIEGYSEHWLWKNHIYRGLVLLGGDGGTGKSSLMTDWIVRVSAGYDWADGSPCKEGSVICYIPEDPFARLKVTARELGAKTQNIYCIGDCNEDFIPFSLDNLSALERLIQQINNNPNIPDVRMLCLDPITAALGDLNENSQSEIRPALKRLGQLTNQYRIATICLIHPRKQGLADRNTSIKDRIAGSAAFTNVPRQVLILQRDLTDHDIRICLTVKHNLSVQPLGFSYRTSKPKPLYSAMDDHSEDAAPVYVRYFEYERWDIDMLADEFNGQGLYANSKQKKKNENQTCADWLKRFLADGPKPSGTPEQDDTIFGEGNKRFKFSRRLIDKNLKDLGCVHQRVGNKTFWSLPEKQTVETGSDFGLGGFSSDEF